MFNIQPGQGLGFIASKEIAFGLGTPFAVAEIVERVLTKVLWGKSHFKLVLLGRSKFDDRN